ncbi:methylenetetrahydrofolate reductase [NAD(P)H] [Acetobacter fallax]|uniref:Methylenetetrahydrofolate reductase n=1 Tax=Acetobacter fallax TaxID=1737473 RepID=A0ABX0KEU8_9PROT|nr:methylenetetrahydrofolate reductase [NAD(P)H] [Acetobacter fallax]NHO32940.1 methylenetetrahydrofolate reductase [NAD(P)H] [Acetobacter fallax]NHO36561.1 methylenetetrahydrofolate reductase [NAD(P)H] [Acetobacter fallax]
MLSETFRTSPVSSSGVDVSFEFFPPKTDRAAEALFQSADNLARFRPRFLSMTYGAGGTTRDRSIEAAATLVRRTDVPVAGHLTCVGASKQDVDSVAKEYWNSGIRSIVALRGDPAVPGTPFEAHPEGYRSAVELVTGLKAVAPFDISVAAYPEVHPEALSAQSDLDNLKAKIDAGADRAITQFFFDPDAFLHFRDRAVAQGITAEIVPGILPVTGVAQAYKFATMCGAHVPERIRALFDGLDEQPETRGLVTTAFAAMMCRTLREHGVRAFHFYTLNRSAQSAALCRLLGCEQETMVSEQSPETSLTQ